MLWLNPLRRLAVALLILPGLQAQDRDFSGEKRPQIVAPANRVDINHASLEELLRVHGMRRSWAERIIRFRPYRSKQDLVDNGIVTGAAYERFRDYIIARRKPQ